MKHVAPARCTAPFSPALFDDSNYIGEPKLDGARYMLYLWENGTVNLYSRRNFPSIDKKDTVPHFAKAYPGLEGTVLDGEVMLPGQKQLGDTTGILNSSPKKAIADQGVKGKLVYHVFDILFYKGLDVRSKAYSERRKLLDTAVSEMENPFVQVVPQSMNKAEDFQSIIKNGGEGLVLKNLNTSYGIGWVKLKKRSDFSVVITGYQEGNGKYTNNLGAILFSVYADGKLTEVGKCSGMTDAERSDIWTNRTKYLSRVIDVFAQEVTKDGRLRHPVWHRFRDDVSKETCTWNKLLSDAKACGLLTK